MASETEQYEMICRDEFAEIKTMIRAIDNAIRGNGKEGLAIRVVKNEERHKLLFWVMSAQAAVLLTLLGKLIYDHLSH